MTLTGEPPPSAPSVRELRDIELWNLIRGSLRSAKAVNEVHRANLNYAIEAVDELYERWNGQQERLF